MKHLFRIMTLVLVMAAGTSLFAQDKAATELHPEVNMYKKALNLNPSQVADLQKIYEVTTKQAEETGIALKEATVKDRELATDESTSPEAKAASESTLDELTTKMRALRDKRQGALKKMLDEEQLKVWNSKYERK